MGNLTGRYVSYDEARKGCVQVLMKGKATALDSDKMKCASPVASPNRGKKPPGCDWDSALPRSSNEALSPFPKKKIEALDDSTCASDDEREDSLLSPQARIRRQSARNRMSAEGQPTSPGTP